MQGMHAAAHDLQAERVQEPVLHPPRAPPLPGAQPLPEAAAGVHESEPQRPQGERGVVERGLAAGACGRRERNSAAGVRARFLRPDAANKSKKEMSVDCSADSQTHLWPP